SYRNGGDRNILGCGLGKCMHASISTIGCNYFHSITPRISRWVLIADAADVPIGVYLDTVLVGLKIHPISFIDIIGVIGNKSRKCLRYRAVKSLTRIGSVVVRTATTHNG